MRNWIFGVCAVLTAGAAQAQDPGDYHAKVGAWDIAAEPDRNLCKMYRYYGSSKDDHVEGVTVRYDAVTDVVGLTWSIDGPTPFPKDGQIDLYLNFVNGKSIDESWGSRTFHHGKPDDTRYFRHDFGAKDSQRFLRDLAANKIIALNLGPVLLTALFLDAAEATASLRKCSSEIAARLPAGTPPSESTRCVAADRLAIGRGRRATSGYVNRVTWPILRPGRASPLL